MLYLFRTLSLSHPLKIVFVFCLGHTSFEHLPASSVCNNNSINAGMRSEEQALLDVQYVATYKTPYVQRCSCQSVPPVVTHPRTASSLQGCAGTGPDWKNHGNQEADQILRTGLDLIKNRTGL